MSHTNHTPQDCELPHPKTVTGTLWQCRDCRRIWKLYSVSIAGVPKTAMKWGLEADPRMEKILRGHTRNQPTTPTITPGMVQSAEAVLDAWRIPGTCPEMHEAAKREVRKAFPYLAARLDEACDTHG